MSYDHKQALATMKIDEIIMNAAFAAEARTGEKPTLLYLGSRQYRELMTWFEMHMHAFPVAPCQVAGYPPRKTFNGMEIYRVDASDHILAA